MNERELQRGGNGLSIYCNEIPRSKLRGISSSLGLKTAVIVLSACVKSHRKINDLMTGGVCGGHRRNKVESGRFCGRMRNE